MVTSKVQETSQKCALLDHAVWTIQRAPKEFQGRCQDNKKVVAVQEQETAEIVRLACAVVWKDSA